MTGNNKAESVRASQLSRRSTAVFQNNNFGENRRLTSSRRRHEETTQTARWSANPTTQEMRRT
jgi:hypothetical protein